ncbi:hypothetical protein HanRHA438_Chr10g0447881 [Helianthus annuus]|nr:hypothetical protein HanIR_Chr10g0469821 [Helianthus annuus]KAJ0879141.1 hypothetical protein HanRHA438_Chr10g0447881 [Helianthus annuus]
MLKHMLIFVVLRNQTNNVLKVLVKSVACTIHGHTIHASKTVKTERNTENDTQIT